MDVNPDWITPCETEKERDRDIFNLFLESNKISTFSFPLLSPS